MRAKRRLGWLCAFVAVVAIVGAASTLAEPRAASPPAAPAGLSAIALDAKVGLVWQASPQATGYAVYRGTSPGAIDERLTPAGFSGTSFVDTTAVNGQTYYYAVRASSDGGESDVGQLARATPQTRSCASGNDVVRENCFPGTTDWKTPLASRAYPDGIEGFASASSVQAGDSVDLRIETTPNVVYRVEIYRTGYYGGDQGRLVSVIPNLSGRFQPSCLREEDTTGIVDCASWSPVATISTTPDWPSGVYLLKLVREDNGLVNEIPLVVRNDGSDSDLLFTVPTSTYQAYNSFFGKNLYDGMSSPPNTISGGPRAVEVSFDRPYNQPTIGPDRHDWYTRTDVATVSWLEQQGYDTTYVASEDVHANGAQLQNHDVVISGSHDEYWSQQMFDAALAARAAGTSLVFLGANASYWKIRFDDGPVSGAPNRGEITYKTVQSGPPDPSGTPTTTWRDPSGPNRPENELIGQMYVGENVGNHFPLRVSAAEGRHRFWRYTSLASLEPGSTAAIGSRLVGWEWDARVANGREPAGVETLASSPVSGALIQENGHSQADGNTIANATLYRAPSGALVFATGTNNWWRGLARNVDGDGEPDQRIQQATTNVLADMGAVPAQPAPGLQLDPTGPPAVTQTTPPDGATDAETDEPLTATFDRDLDPASVDDADFTLTGPGGAAVDGDVSYDRDSRRLVLHPSEPLAPFGSYTARVGTGLRAWNGASPASSRTWSFSTGQGAAPAVVERAPASGAEGVRTDTAVTARFSRPLDASTVNGGTFTLTPTGGGAAVPAQVSYDDATSTARLDPSQRLAESSEYTAELTTGIEAADGTPMASASSWTFTTGTNLSVVERTPEPLATGVSPSAVVRVVFSRDADPATIDGDSITLTGPAGTPVPAQVSYDVAARTATLRPILPLLLLSTYRVRLDASIRATDGAPLEESTWTFSTALNPLPPPEATALTPAPGTTGVSSGTTVHATFDRALDPATVNTQSFFLTPDGGSPVAADVSYDAASKRATLTPLAALDDHTRYTARITTAVRSSLGAPLAAPVTWSFTTERCPCHLMTSQTPTQVGIPVRDFRPEPGPWSYELGTRITTDEATELVALRFYKDTNETGAHVGRVWNAAGTQLASVTFENESDSGWQRQTLPAPVPLQPGQAYTVSVGLNEYYVKSVGGLSEQLVSGPLRSAAGANGVYAPSAGSFPTNSWQASNYFVDGVVRIAGQAPRTPQVTATTPPSGASGVPTDAQPTATFSVPLDPGTVNAGTFTLTDSGGQPVPGQVSYDDETRRAIFQPGAPLHAGASYTARLATGIRSDDGTPMASPVSWTFGTVTGAAPTVTAASPADGTTDVSPVGSITATFSQPMNPATLGPAFTLSGPGGAAVPANVSYDSTLRTATLTPTGPLAASTAYTARVGPGAESAAGTPLGQAATWAFTTSACPCRLFAGEPSFQFTGLDTRNYRSGSGPWSLELGVKVRVTQPARLEAVRYYRDAAETGPHTARVWTPSGALIASLPFSGESGSGWQQQELTTPIELAPGQVYVISVGMNAAFGMSPTQLADEIASGPLRSVADGQNGVYGDAAGVFPNQSWSSSNYYVDAVVR